jgi:3-oxoacyl-[acyl-carrier protein] reductase
MNPRGKVALVTGGGTGIGRATALLLAERGADVAVNYSRSDAEARDTVDALSRLGRRAIAIRADVSDDAQVRRMVTEVVERLGRLDVLVNNAGWTRQIDLKDLEAVDDATWERTLAVNVKGSFYCIRAAAPHLKADGDGVIVNVSSLAGLMGQGSSLPYTVSKAALNRLTRALTRVLAPEVRINAVAPGVVDTRWVAKMESFVRSGRMQTPLRRIARPEDVAEVIVAIVADMGFVTGQIIPVDGGLSG